MNLTFTFPADEEGSFWCKVFGAQCEFLGNCFGVGGHIGKKDIGIHIAGDVLGQKLVGKEDNFVGLPAFKGPFDYLGRITGGATDIDLGLGIGIGIDISDDRNFGKHSLEFPNIGAGNA